MLSQKEGMSMLLCYKAILYATQVMFWVLVCQSIYYGFRDRRHREQGLRLPEIASAHERVAKFTVLVLWSYVLFVESARFLFPGNFTANRPGWLHLVCAFYGAIALTAARFVFTGTNGTYRWLHKWVVYPAIVAMAIATLTGVPLIWNL